MENIQQFKQELEDIKKSIEKPFEHYVTDYSKRGMAISLESSAFMMWLCKKMKFKILMDRGSGFSSYILRRYSKMESNSIVYSIDHDKEWLEKTKLFLKLHKLSTKHLYLWNDFYPNKIRFDFILEDAIKPLRLSTPDEMYGLLKKNGFILWDDANSHGGLIGDLKEKHKFYDYNIREHTTDFEGRYNRLTSTLKESILDEYFEKWI